MTHVVCADRCGKQVASGFVELAILVESADEVDIRCGRSAACELVTEQSDQLGTGVLGRKPTEMPSEPDHPHADRGSVVAARKREIWVPSRPVLRDLVQHRSDFRQLASLLIERPHVVLEVVEEQPHFGHVTTEHLVNEFRPMRR